MSNVPTSADDDLFDGAEGAPVVRVQGPADLAQAIPYLLGFHPSRSLVLVGLAAKRVVVTARVDLDDLIDVSLLPRTVFGMVRGGADTIVGVVFDDDLPPGPYHQDLPWQEVAADLHRVAPEAGAAIAEVALIRRGRMWSYECCDPRCCPPQGRELSGTSPVAAAAAYAGMVALPDRASLARLLQPGDDAEAAPELARRLGSAHRAATDVIAAGGQSRLDRSDVRALFAAARAFDDPLAEPELATGQLARFAVALRRLPVRDPVWVGVDDGRIDGRRLWRLLATRLPAPYAAAPLFLFGWATYRAGDGALAGIAAERALENDPDYSAADLILAALSNAVDPRQLPRLRSSRTRPAGVTAGRRGGRPAGAGRKRR